MNLNAWRIATLVTLSVAIICGTLATLASGRFRWGTPEVPRAQCEALLTAQAPAALQYQATVGAAIIREPQNTWSNLAFVFVGVLVATHDRRTFPQLLGLALIGLGVASGLYHASLLPMWRTTDVAMMSWVSVALGCVGIAAVWHNPSRILLNYQLGIGCVGGGLAMLAAVFRNDIKLGEVKPFDSTYTTVAGVVIISSTLLLGIAWGFRRGAITQPPWVRLGLLTVVLLVAVSCQLGDHPGQCFCSPTSVVQAHAVWHASMAFAVALAYDVFAAIENKAPLVRHG